MRIGPMMKPPPSVDRSIDRAQSSVAAAARAAEAVSDVDIIFNVVGEGGADSCRWSGQYKVQTDPSGLRRVLVDILPCTEDQTTIKREAARAFLPPDGSVCTISPSLLQPQKNEGIGAQKAMQWRTQRFHSMPPPGSNWVSVLVLRSRDPLPTSE